MKIAHEAPLSIINEVDAVTDYSYFLVHLLEENKEYLDWAMRVTDSGRESILDNSIFELGTAFDSDKFAKWVQYVNPTYYIVPDALEDKNLTIEQFDDFTERYPFLPGNTIAVVQGKSYLEIVECYNYLIDRCDKIAISFDYSLFEDWFPNEKTKYHKWMKGRQQLLQKMLDEGIIRKDKLHHLLGCGIASEFSYYKDWTWIDSVDTSNPVVAGLKGMRYEQYKEGWALNDKPSEKLCTLIEAEVQSEQKKNIIFNVQKFRDNVQ